MCWAVNYFFFFSSRRRHTRLQGDWSSDVCSSDLWADEWQLKFAALWLSQQINAQKGVVNKDLHEKYAEIFEPEEDGKTPVTDRKSTRLNSSHLVISYAVFCLKKKKKTNTIEPAPH